MTPNFLLTSEDLDLWMDVNFLALKHSQEVYVKPRIGILEPPELQSASFQPLSYIGYYDGCF